MNTMKTAQAETTHAPKRRGYRFWLSCFLLLLGLPLLFYYGYCWGLWGRSSLLLQYFFQCSCPPVSEEARYSEQVDVIIPACHNVNVGTRLSPSGRLLYVREEMAGMTTAYLLDIQTRQRMDVTDQPFPSFLTDDLWLVDIEHKNFIMDRITGAQYPIQRFVYSRPDGQINGETNLPLLAESLRQAEQVFLIGASTDTVVALASDSYTHPEQNFIVEKYDVPGFNTERFLQENHIPYQTVLRDFPDEALSPDGRFIARPDGIYFVETGKKIVDGYSLSVRGWTYDGRGVIYSHAFGRCLFQIGFPFADDTGCYRRVPQPILILKVPEEYLLPAQTP